LLNYSQFKRGNLPAKYALIKANAGLFHQGFPPGEAFLAASQPQGDIVEGFPLKYDLAGYILVLLIVLPHWNRSI
jgi:hypothetical protein